MLEGADSGAPSSLPPEGFVEQPITDDDPAFDELPDDPVSVSVARATMTGDLINLVIELIKQADKPWSMMTEYEQNLAIGRARIAVAEAVAKAVDVIACDDRPTVDASIAEVKMKSAQVAEAKVTFVRSQEHAGEVILGSPRRVKIVLTNVEDYGGGDVQPADKDEPGLPI